MQNASDSDGIVNKVEFFQGAVKLGEDTTAPYSFNWTNVSAGSYVLTARATDNIGATATSSAVNITVNQPPTVTLTSPTNNATFTAGSSVTINATASDSDGTISKVEFFQGTVKLGEDAAAPYSFNWTSLPAGSYALTARATDNGGANTTSSIINITVNQTPIVRLDPLNQTGGEGENPLSRNFNWSVPLVGLPGRAGLDLGLSLSYNSLVWTKNVSNSTISFNDDGGFPSPGFRLGFPVIQSRYFNSLVGKYAYMLITSNGERVELRQVNTSAIYEAADSSYLTLVVNADNTITVRTTDGTQLSYEWKVKDFQCTRIKDRNGNFISINYNGSGRIDTVVDTLSRTIKFNYDTGGYLSSITQVWNQGTANEQNHEWASFTYNPSLPIQTNFSGVTNVGPQNGSTLKVLTSVKLNNNSSRFDFDYTSWGQMWKISDFAADGHLLNYRAYNLPGSQLLATSPQDDCPRFTERHDWAENWNRTDPLGTALLPAAPEQEVVTSYAVPVNTSWTLPDGTTMETGTVAQVTQPDGTFNKIYFAGTAGTSSGWKRGLPSLVETFGKTTPDQGSPVIRQRSSVTLWRQVDETVSYLLNPRVQETNVYDFNASGQIQNRARSSVSYQTANFSDGTSCRLPQDVSEYQANATTVLRRTHTEYNLDSAYTSRRIIGLVSEKTLYEVDPNTATETLMSKVGFQYDEAGSIQGTDAPVQHDNTNYSASFVTGRANLSSVKRYDVSNTSQFTLSTIKYNTAGATVANIDPLGHQVSISYADSFSDNNNSRNTLAFPSSVTDPDGFSSTAQYNFDLGLVTRTQGPPPAGQTVGAIKSFIYDSLARIQKVAIEFNGNADYSHARFEYPTSQNRVDTYATIQEGLGEAHSFKIVDGHGRTIASASDHPGSTGGFSGQLVLYDNLGRVIKTSNSTETSASGTPSQWVAAGDDATAGWLYAGQTYDWKGRPLVSTNTDGTTKSASYGGCGCAGDEVVTLTDEGTMDGGAPKRRQQKIYSDVLGRTVKTEMLNWQGGSPYSTTINTYNARDQVKLVRQFDVAQGTVPLDPNDLSCPTGSCQQTTMSYDGYGRLKTKHVPEQDPNTVTTYNYNPDDTASSVIDARGSSSIFTYNSRGLVTHVAYDPSAGVTDTPDVSFVYDAAGNRTSMSDGLGSVTYAYDQLSRLTSESRNFTSLGTYALNYAYNLSGELTSINDQTSSTTLGYAYDSAGRLSGVTGTGYPGVSQFASNMQYRAWGSLKSMNYGNGKTLSMGYNSRLLPSSYSVPGTISKTYQYYADGRMDYSQDTLDARYDRQNQFDHAGRVSVALSGAEARDEAATNERPYNETFQYDSWGNNVGRTIQQWSRPDSSLPTTTYVNNRRSGWNYNEAGEFLDDGTFNALQWKYDAAGQLASIMHPAFPTNPKRTDDYNGDGERLRTGYHQRGCSPEFNCPFEYTYYLRSTVLGGQIISEIRGNGQKSMGYVYYPSGDLIAVQKLATPEDVAAYVVWQHNEPAGLSVRATDATGSANGFIQERFNAELDPTRGSAGREDPGELQLNQPDENSPSFPGYGNLLQPARGCIFNGIPLPDCGWLLQDVDELDVLLTEAARSARTYRWKLMGTLTSKEIVEDDPDNNIVRQSNSVTIGLYGLVPTSRWSSGSATSFFSGLSRTLQQPQNPVPTPTPCPGSIPEAAARQILEASAREGVDPTLLSVTWRHEAIPSFGSNTLPHARYSEDGRAIVGYDVGPMQISTNYYNKSPFTDGLPQAFKGAGADDIGQPRFGQLLPFSGNVMDNLRAGARAFTMDILNRSRSLADAAGLFRAGSRTGPGYRDRFNQYQREAPGDRRQLNCLRGAP